MLSLSQTLDLLGVRLIAPLSTRKIQCPLPNHNTDNTPSFQYYYKTDSFYCFGCNRGGSSFQFAFYYLHDLNPSVTYEELQEKFLYNTSELILDSLEADLNQLEYVETFDYENFNFRVSSLIGYFLRENPKHFEYCERLFLNVDRIIAQEDEKSALNYLENLSTVLRKKQNVSR